jgi:hypothetical protein
MVVVSALGILGESRRRDFVPLARRLLGSSDPEVRCAAMRALSAAGEGDDFVAPLLEDPSPSVQATAVVALLGRSSDESAVREKLRSIMASRQTDARIALARAIRYRSGPVFHPIMMELAGRSEPAVRAELARTIAAATDPALLQALIPMLTDRHARADARVALCAIGRPALASLQGALADPATPHGSASTSRELRASSVICRRPTSSSDISSRSSTPLERVFRILGLRHPDEDFHAIYAGLRSGDGRMASSSCGLLEYLIEPRTRVIIQALADPDRPLSPHLLDRSSPLRGQPPSWEEALRAMADDRSEVLAALATHLVAHPPVTMAPANEQPLTESRPEADRKELSLA